MPYDGTDFEPWPKPPPRRTTVKERVLCAAVFIFAILMLVMPFSAGTFSDILHYISHK